MVLKPDLLPPKTRMAQTNGLLLLRSPSLQSHQQMEAPLLSPPCLYNRQVTLVSKICSRTLTFPSTVTHTCMWCWDTPAQLWPPLVDTDWYRCPPPPGSVVPVTGSSDLFHIPNLLPAHEAVPSEDGNNMLAEEIMFCFVQQIDRMGHYGNRIHFISTVDWAMTYLFI